MVGQQSRYQPESGVAEIGNKWFRKIYQSMEGGRARGLYLRADSIARKYGGGLYGRTIKQLKRYVRDAAAAQNGAMEDGTSESPCWNCEKKAGMANTPLVSVILSVTAHSIRLEECMKCIYDQSYPNIEVLILEYGLSEDDSKAIAEHVRFAPMEVTVLSSNQDMPCVLEQWNKGLGAAKGSFLWFADSQCRCGRNFLRDILAMFSYDSVRAVFAGGEGDSGIYCGTGSQAPPPCGFGQREPFYMTAHDMVCQGAALWGRIPFLSSVVFKSRRPMAVGTVESYSDMKAYAAWIFILYMVRGGVVGYSGAAADLRLVAAASPIPDEMGLASYYKEVEDISDYIAQNYKVEDGYYESVIRWLAEQQKKGGGADAETTVRQHYRLERILAGKRERKPNVLMACYALRTGGGELYPIHLANELCRKGLAVTLINFGIEEEEEGIRQLIDADVPVVTIKSRDYLGQIITRLGGEVIHSHCASVDEVIAQWRKHNHRLGCHVITLHGMYEAMEEEDCSRVIADTWENGASYVYIAAKNLECFRHHGCDTNGGRFTRIPNGLPAIAFTPVRRDALGIPEHAFVLVIASRGIPEKGWKEAVAAVMAADRRCSRAVHLVIVGDGEVRAELEKDAPSNVHFVGFRPNVRDYFAMADAGLMPTYFKGESYPLATIECLMTGTPVIATDMAEIRNQLKDESGDLAGILLPLHAGRVDEEDICTAILELADDHDRYMHLKRKTASACRKFDMTVIADKHICLYQKMMTQP